MPPTTTAFGRRGAQTAAPAPPPRAARPPPPTPPLTAELSPEAEAFRAEIAAGRGDRSAAFAGWRRSKGWERWLMLGVRAFSFVPGVVSFVMDAPLELSIGLEVAAFAGNIWFRATRRRRMREIVAWQDPADRG